MLPSDWLPAKRTLSTTQDAGLRNVCMESGVIADGSAAGVLKGRSHNRAIWFHKIMFEALNRLAWNGFQRWIEEHHKA